MAKLTRCVGSLLSVLGVLVLVGVAGAPNVASAENGDAGVLHACVYKNLRDGEVHGYIRIVLPAEACRRFEARFLLNVGGHYSGDDAEGGTIHGQILSCLSNPAAPAAGSFAAVAGHQSLVVFTNDTGEFELHAPPGTHELVFGVPGVAEVGIVSGVIVNPGEVTEVNPPPLCSPS